MDPHTDAWRVWAHQLPTDGAGVRIADMPVTVTATDGAHRDAALTSIGYAPLPANTRLASEDHRRFLHRHVALIVSDVLCENGRQWIRELARASEGARALVQEWFDDGWLVADEQGPPA